MTRSEGFTVMDVSTSICDDSKFRRLQREAPQHVAVAFTAYVATMAESWKAGRRVAIEDAWPAFIPFDSSVVSALQKTGLIDSRGRLNSKSWRDWFESAYRRRAQARERWAKYNAKRDADTTPPPRGNDAATATSVPSVLPSVPSYRAAPSVAGAREAKAKNGQMSDEERRKLLEEASTEYKAGRMTEFDYQSLRRTLAS